MRKKRENKEKKMRKNEKKKTMRKNEKKKREKNPNEVQVFHLGWQ